jgi:hypothetical protein
MSNPKFTAPLYTVNDAATYKANIDASVAANGSDVVNLGFSYASGTGVFTVHDAQGNSLSSSNPAFVRFQDKANPGYNKYISIEANQNFTDDAGSSEIINNLFGLTTSVAHADDIPFYLYAVANDDMDTVQMMISRVPNAALSPAVANIGAPDDAVADTQGAFFSLDNIDETAYDQNPCVCVGSFRMTMSASDDWTVSTLDNKDGIGKFQENRTFVVSAGQFGAASGGFIKSNGGTAPSFTTDVMTYRVSADGRILVSIYLSGDGGTDGSGSVTTQVAAPFVPADLTSGASGGIPSGGMFGLQIGGTDAQCVAQVSADGSDNNITFFDVVGSRGTIQHADFTNSGRYIRGYVDYFINTGA